MAKGMMASTEARTQTQPRPITRELASFASKLRYEKIPEEVRKRVLLLTLDQIGAALVELERVQNFLHRVLQACFSFVRHLFLLF